MLNEKSTINYIISKKIYKINKNIYLRKIKL